MAIASSILTGGTENALINTAECARTRLTERSHPSPPPGHEPPLRIYFIRIRISHGLGWNRVEYVKLTGKYSEPSGHLESLLFLADYF